MENNENNAPSRNYRWVAEGDNRPLDESMHVLALMAKSALRTYLETPGLGL